MNNHQRTKRKIRGRVKTVSRMYNQGNIDEGVFRTFVRMAMAQKIYSGLKNKLEKQSRRNHRP